MLTTTSNNQLDLARLFIESTGKNLFLTGKAGTGKTTFLKDLRLKSPKRMVVVAPTGVAAINAGGVTIHSFFQLPFGPQIPNQYLAEKDKKGELSMHLNREKLNIIRSLDLLVIDEISMVRADLLDAIDGVLRRVRRRQLPFGGVQVLMIGDLQQLAPVIKDDDWAILKAYYSGPFFFQSKVLERFPAETIELKTIFRQKDQLFIDLLNQIRENRLTTEGLQMLNSRYQPAMQQLPGYITLTSHNRQAQYINEQKLQAIPFNPFIFKAEIEGDFPEYAYPNDTELILKKGAQVMFIKNDSSREKLYYNGKIGVVESINNNIVRVRCDGDDHSIEVGAAQWQNFKYSLNPTTNEIDETITGTFTQFPLKLAWAITIHKSQGLTFEKAIIDANAAFAHGQVYVALSRCRTLEGLILSSPIDERSIISSQSVNSFIEKAATNIPTPERIRSFQIEYEQELITELFDFSRLLRHLKNLKKEIDENRNIVFGSLPEKTDSILGVYETTVSDVSAKFKQQLQQLFTRRVAVSDDPQLQERICKGCDYFLGKLVEIIEPLTTGVELETDNKAVRKSITEALNQIASSFTTHNHCLRACTKGFTIAGYLAAKSVSLIEKEVQKPKFVKDTKPPVTSSNPELYQQLRTWRNSRADELNLPVYMVVPTKALIEVAEKMPASERELLKVKGFGKRKTQQFGDEILKIIKEYCIDKGIEQQPDSLIPEPMPKKPPKIPTWKNTVNLYRLGLSIEAIAKKQNLVQSTIEGHLAKAIEHGEIDITSVLDHTRIKTIQTYLQNNPGQSLTEAKNGLGTKFSFGDIKMVIAERRKRG